MKLEGRGRRNTTHVYSNLTGTSLVLFHPDLVVLCNLKIYVCLRHQYILALPPFQASTFGT